MIIPTLRRDDDSVPSSSATAAEPAKGAENGQPLVNGQSRRDNGHGSENGMATRTPPIVENGKTSRKTARQKKREKRRMTRSTPSSRVSPPAAQTADAIRPALAVFCWEHPDSPIGSALIQSVAALAKRQKTVHLFSRFPANLGLPALHEHPVGDVEGDNFFARVQEFSSRAVNAYLHQFPGGSPHVTLMGYEWSGAGPLSLLRGLKNNRTIFSLSSMERQRSDMSAPISQRINEVECATLRESQVILVQESAAADAARYWVPECAPRLVAARQPFPAAAFSTQVDPGQVKSRFQVGPIDPTILYVGDMSDRYGPDLLVKAMPAILRNHPQARLILVGDGPLFWTTRVYSRYLLLDHAIRFPGSVVGQAMAELVEAVDVVAVPSRDSTPWWPIQAAWAAQRPLVATHHAAPGLLEHERDSVLVYAAEQSIVWGIERILYDAEFAARIGKHGRAKLEERFGWNTVAAQIEELMGVAVNG